MRERGKSHRAKARQASKLAEIRAALIAAGCNTTAKQASALGLGRSTAWIVLNGDKRAGPSVDVLKRILASSTLPMVVRQKVEEYVTDKAGGLYGHSEQRAEAFRDQFRALIKRASQSQGNRPLVVGR